MHSSGKKFKLTRIAPTPSGYLHLGNAFSFALTSAIAKKTGAEILLRIDDLDRDRIELAYVDDIFDTLNFLQIPWQRGPMNVAEYKSDWSQLGRLNIYQPLLEALANNGYVFACTCSRKQLQTPAYECKCAEKNFRPDMPDTAWRILTDERDLTVNTLAKGIVKCKLPPEMKNFIVRKKDGYPAYQLTSLLDDVHFGVDLIIRGEDLWHSTLAQHYLASILNISSFNKIVFHHHQLLTAENNTKLSKSSGSLSIQYMRAQGMSAGGIYAQIPGLVSPDNELLNL